MIRNKGMCSVTFRKFSPKKVIDIAKKSRLTHIEWGGDVHVPENNLLVAEKIRKLTEKNNLHIVSYGSYFCCDDVERFKKVSETAQRLGASIIRVWAGKKDAERYTEKEFSELVATVKVCCRIAQEKGQIIAFEYHARTYNNRPCNTLKLLSAIGENNVKTYWQPPYWEHFFRKKLRIQYNLDSIQALKAHIVCVHVYHWKNLFRLPFCLGKKEWKKYNELLPDCYGFLEFVKNNSERRFFTDVMDFLDL